MKAALIATFLSVLLPIYGFVYAAVIFLDDFESLDYSYCYTGFENSTHFAFWFYRDNPTNEFDVEIGYHQDIRDVRIATAIENQWWDRYVLAPQPFNNSNWHTIKIDWKGNKVTVTIDDSLIVEN